MPPRDPLVSFNLSEMHGVAEEARALAQTARRQAIAAARARAYALYRQLPWVDRFWIRIHIALHHDCDCAVHKLLG
mgnify:CR=1 FL=1